VGFVRTYDERVGGTDEPRPAGLRQRKKQLTRRALLDAAERLFEQRGYDNVTVAEIADAANISVKTLFTYFASKEDLAFGGEARLRDELVAAITGRPARGSVLGTVAAVLHRRIDAATHPDETTRADAPQASAAQTDAPPADAAQTDAPPADAAHTDAAQTDAAHTDAAQTDAAHTDAAQTDAAQTDAAQTDAAQTDAAQAGEGQADAAAAGEAAQADATARGGEAARAGGATAWLEGYHRGYGESVALQSRLRRMWHDYEDALTAAISDSSTVTAAEARLLAMRSIVLMRSLTTAEVRDLVAAAPDPRAALHEWLDRAARALGGESTDRPARRGSGRPPG
jgi:AcrR family transcriptional regulator